MTTTRSATATSGLISGLDSAGIISKIVAADGVPKMLLSNQVMALQAKNTAITALVSRLKAVSTSLGAMTGTRLDAMSVTLGDGGTQMSASVVNASAVRAGTYSVQATALASAQTQTSQGYDSATATGTLTTGAYSITYGTQTASFTLDGTNSSLEGLATAVNAAMPGMSAYVVDSGAVAGRYRLVLQGETGASHAFSLTAPPPPPPPGAIPAMHMAPVPTVESSAFPSESATGTIARGTYTVTYGAATTSFAIDASDSSLDGFVARVGAAGIANLSASVVSSGPGAYQVVLEGAPGGPGIVVGWVPPVLPGTPGPGAPLILSPVAAQAAVSSV